MPRVQVYLPEDLHEQLKKRDLPASELLQVALRAELERQDALAETDRYLEELAAEVGEPSQRQQATADAIARRIRDRSLDRVGWPVLVLDSGGVSRLSARTKTALSLIGALKAQELWPPVVPTMVLVESLQGDPRRDANTHRFLKMCIIEPTVSESTARRAAELRRRARAGSAVDALVVAIAEPSGTVLTGDRADIEALAAHANAVAVEVVWPLAIWSGWPLAVVPFSRTILHRGLRNGDAEGVTREVERVLGRPPRTLDEYLADHASRWEPVIEPTSAG